MHAQAWKREALSLWAQRDAASVEHDDLVGQLSAANGRV
jgi:hypothetical protein